MTDNLITPYGGTLLNLCLAGDERERVKEAAGRAAKLLISESALCDLELLATGAFSPLSGFMGKKDYESVVGEMKLANGTLWPLPVTLEAPKDFQVPADKKVALVDHKGVLLGLLTVEDDYTADLEAEKAHIYANNEEHPTLARLRKTSTRRLGGRLQVIQPPIHHDFRPLRRTPAEVRQMLNAKGWKNVTAFQTRNPLHRAHEELVRRASEEVQDGGVLVHPVVGMTKPGDVDHFTRVRIYQCAMQYFDEQKVALSLLPLAMRMAGPREALFHAIIRRNHGVNGLIIGRDHAGPGKDSKGKEFYGPYDAQELLRKHSATIGVKPVEFKMQVYVPDKQCYLAVDQVPAGMKTADISGTQVRKDYLEKGLPLPDWFTRKEIAQVLSDAYPPRVKQGVTVWLTGLSQAGKSTIAEILAMRLLEHGRPSTNLDGDVVRTHLSKGLGFSKEDRDMNIRRIGYVAAEITRHGGTVLVAAISPYKDIRQENRERIGNYVEVFVNAPIDVCEARDQKGNYRAAREGKIKGFTGVDDPYEMPTHDFLELRTDRETPQESAEKIMSHLTELGYLS